MGTSVIFTTSCLEFLLAEEIQQEGHLLRIFFVHHFSFFFWRNLKTLGGGGCKYFCPQKQT